MQFEIIPTSLGDCGCVSTNAGFKKRLRFPASVEAPDCRQPRAMGTIEKGFGIRFGTSARNRVNKYRTMQEIVCEKEVLIHCGVKNIPEAHILTRWTRGAKDFDYQFDSNPGSIDSELRNSVLYVNALEVVQSAEKDAEASEILFGYLRQAKMDIERLLDDRNNTTENNATSGDSSDSASENGESDFDDGGNGNMYGAAGSSAYMSDADIQSIQAPTVRNPSGWPRENRFPRMFECLRGLRKVARGGKEVNLMGIAIGAMKKGISEAHAS
ncbi:uncharacterized protein C2845_PM11G25570 [Panicum miliaceum]|uniref:Protein FAR1-RELATED SEQUENCE n=1 Tax=Panicum miliaceum TaxID=4540 RepID=A0A3L6RW68_PANMI|nr:uncharacterized protein C2845_PM11G25570 [Panicum miliaceum]